MKKEEEEEKNVRVKGEGILVVRQKGRKKGSKRTLTKLNGRKSAQSSLVDGMECVHM